MKLKRMISVLATVGVCLSLISCNLLPENLGGTSGSSSGDNSIDNVKENFAQLLGKDDSKDDSKDDDDKQAADDDKQAADDDKQAADDENDGKEPESENDSNLPGDTSKYGYTYKIGQIKYVDEENSYLIAYPQIEFTDGRSADDINETIKRCASYQMDLMYPVFQYNQDLYQGRCESNVSFEITYCDENIISIVFSDHYFVGSIFSEYYDYRSMVMDLNTGDYYKLGAVIDADDEFAEKMYKQLISKDETWKERPGFDASMMKQAITNGTTDDSRFIAYLYITEKKELGIAFSYHYGYGGVICRGCMDLQASDSDIKNIMRDSDLWGYLGK